MPCSDVTETLTVVLDAQEHLRHYVLRKKSCDRLIGAEALLAEFFANSTIEQILATTADRLPATDDEMHGFLQCKHLYALQAVLNAYIGEAPAGEKEPCAIAEIVTDEQGATIQARISVDLLTEKIQACSGAKGCSGCCKH